MYKRLENKIRVELIGPLTGNIIEDLDISVKMEKTNETSPNYCTVTIYNLSEDTNNNIKQNMNGARVYLAQGEETAYQLVFQGDLRDIKKYKKPSKSSAKPRKTKKKGTTPHYNEPSITTEYDDTDVKTVIELQDGKKASLNDNFFIKSYKGYVSNKTVINDILNTFRANNVPIGKIDSLPEIQYNNGKVYHGSAVSLLNSLCARAGGSFYIQNGVISITNSANRPQNIGVIFNGYNCAKPEEEKDFNIKLETPLIPTLNPNDWVTLDFTNISGPHKIYKIESEFDNFGEACGSEIICRSK